MGTLLKFLTSERSRDYLVGQVTQLQSDLKSECDRTSLWETKRNDGRLTDQQRMGLEAALMRRENTLHEAKSIEARLIMNRDKFGVLGKGKRIQRQLQDLRWRVESLRAQVSLFQDIVPNPAHAIAVAKANPARQLHLISNEAGLIEVDIDGQEYQSNDIRVEALGRGQVRLRGFKAQSLRSTAGPSSAASVVETLDSDDKPEFPRPYGSKEATSDWVGTTQSDFMKRMLGLTEEASITPEQPHVQQDIAPMSSSSQVEPHEYLSNAIRTTAAATSALTPQQQMALALGTLVPAGLYGIGSAGIAEHARRVASRAADAAERSAAAAEAQKDIALKKDAREKELHDATMLKMALERRKLELEIAEKLKNTKSSPPGDGSGKDEGYDSGDTDAPSPPPDTRDDSDNEDDASGPANQSPHPPLLVSAFKQDKSSDADAPGPASQPSCPPLAAAAAATVSPLPSPRPDKGKAPLRELPVPNSLPILPTPPCNEPDDIEMHNLKSGTRQMVPS